MKYPDDWVEMSAQEREEFVVFIRDQRERAEQTYKGVPDDRRRYCTDCGELMDYNSLAYHEGYHFDGCD